MRLGRAQLFASFAKDRRNGCAKLKIA